MRKEEFYFDSRDGQTRLHAVRWIPKQEVRCVLQIVHGMAEYVERYEPLACLLAKEGILVTGEDHLGHGKSLYGRDGKEKGHPLGYFCRQDPATVTVRDVHRLKKITQQQYPGVPYLILGHSMGSFILRNYLFRYGSGIDGAVIMGTGMLGLPLLKCAKALAAVLGLLQGEKHPSMLLNAAAFGAYNKQIENPQTPVDWLSTDQEQVRRYVEDELCGFCFTVNGFAALFELLARLHDKKGLETMPRDLPVLFMAGECDPVGDYGKAVRSVADSFRKAGMQKVDCRLYPGMRHEILNEKERQTVEADLLKWVIQTAELQISKGQRGCCNEKVKME